MLCVMISHRLCRPNFIRVNRHFHSPRSTVQLSMYSFKSTHQLNHGSAHLRSQQNRPAIMSVPPEDIPQNHTIPTSEKVIPQTDVESEREPTLCLMIDNYDSFTFNLYQYFCQLGAEMLVKRNDEITIPEVEVSPQDGCGEPGPSYRDSRLMVRSDLVHRKCTRPDG